MKSRQFYESCVLEAKGGFGLIENPYSYRRCSSDATTLEPKSPRKGYPQRSVANG